jgi:parallel beta-helix repeat protein
MRWNYVHHQGQLGYTAGGAAGLIEGNEFAYNNTAFFGPGRYAGAGGGKAAFTKGLIVRGNFSHHNHGPGLWTDINNVDCLYENNTVEDNEWRGIFHEISYDCVIRNNVVRRNGLALPRTEVSAADGAGTLISDSRNVEIYGNTVEANRNGIMGIDADRQQHPSPLGAHDLVNLWVHHNTVEQLTGRAGGVADRDPDADPYSAVANNRWDFNHYHLGPTTKFRWAPNVDVSPDAWVAAGQDPAGVLRVAPE